MIPKTNRYVVATWIQSGNVGASVVLLNPKTARVNRPYDRGVGGDFQYAEFSVPKVSLIDKELLVFMLPGRSPGVVSLKSIAWTDYQVTSGDIAELRENGIDASASDGDQVEQLRKLHLLDPSLKSEANVATASEPTPAARSLPPLQLDRRYMFGSDRIQ